RQTEVDAKVIMTTAYDSYAIKAFEAGSVDYLLKPIDVKDLHRAVERCRKNTTTPDIAALLEAFRRPAREFKERFIVKFNDRIVPVKTSEIAYFYSEDKYNYLVTTAGAVYIADKSLDEIAEELDPHAFFKISRSCIVSLGAIISITKLVGGRLQISARPKPSFDMVVSRSRSDDFLTWLER
ncbi:MAG: LytTR family DNA-binding domain-containing protein, partial [Bacteroidales bacterium]|nr:LytTR family DNA-binding domain-containing protein [Bacteroidales bacterium]